MPSSKGGRPKGAVTIPSLARPKKKPGPKPKEDKESVAKLVGRPPGLAAKMEEIRRRLILSDSDAVIRNIVDIATNPDHKDQAMMLKFLGDRLLPLGSFEQVANPGAGLRQIVITGATGPVRIGSSTIEIGGQEAPPTVDVVDVDATEVLDE